MKGNRQFPRGGFWAHVVQILDHLGVPYKGLNVLENEELRNGIKSYSNWPTIPQLYVKGEFVGGCDIVREMFQAGELQSLMKEKGLPVKADAPAWANCAYPPSTDALHHQINDGEDHADADQARRRYVGCEFLHVVGNRRD